MRRDPPRGIEPIQQRWLVEAKVTTPVVIPNEPYSNPKQRSKTSVLLRGLRALNSFTSVIS